MISTAHDETPLLRLCIEQAPVAMAMLDRSLRFIVASRRWQQLMNLDGQDLRGRSYGAVCPDLAERWRERLQRVLQGEVIAAEPEPRPSRDGRVQWFRWDLRPWYQRDVLSGLILFVEDLSRRRRTDQPALPSEASEQVCWQQRARRLEQDIADLKRNLEMARRLQRQLQDQASHDPLTGLFNRRVLDGALRDTLQRSTADRHGAGLIMLDIDRFKQINDSFGHLAGDAVLRQTGAIIRRSIRHTDIACRYGGDEFTLILPQTDLFATTHIAELLHQRLNHVREGIAAWPLPPMGFSMGIAAWPEHGSNEQPLLACADQALYKAKRAGGDRVVVAPRC